MISKISRGINEGMKIINIPAGIYAIVHLESGRRYVGSAADIGLRWWTHQNALSKGFHANAHLQRAWNKYGAEAFHFIVLEHCQNGDLLRREQIHMDKQSEYNILPVAGRTEGVKRRPETIKKMKVSSKKWWNDPKNKAHAKAIIDNLHSPESRAKGAASVRTPKERARRSAWAKEHLDESVERLSSPKVRDKINRAIRMPKERKRRSEAGKSRMADPVNIALTHNETTKKKRGDFMRAKWQDPEYRERMSGYKLTPETKAKISAASKGKPKSPEHCAHMSEARKGGKHSPEAKNKMSLIRKAWWAKKKEKNHVISPCGNMS